MDANLPRWIFQSIASHFQSVAADLSLPFLVEGIDERSDETMHSDHVELRVTGPTVKEISRDYYDTDTVINFLFTKAMDPVDTNAYDLIQWTGAFASAMLLPIPIYKKGSGPDDDGSFISCLRIAKGKKEAARIYHFGQLDKDTPVRQSEVDAVFNMDYYSGLVINPPQLVFSVLALTSGVIGEKTRPATTTMNLTSSATAAKLLNRSATTTMNLIATTSTDQLMTRSAATTMNLTSSVGETRTYSIATTMSLTDIAVGSRLLNRSASTTMSLNSDAVGAKGYSVATTMSLTDNATAGKLLNRSAATTMNLTSGVTALAADGSFRSTWNTSNTSSGSSNIVQVALPLVSGGTYNFVVEWGDSTDDTITAYGDAAKTHTYNSSGNYDIVIRGEIKGWQFNDVGDRLKISNIANWGTLGFTDLEGTFEGCEDLTINANDGPRSALGSGNFHSFFRDCPSLVGGSGFADWDLSSTTNMQLMFRGCSVFNSDISSWNTANVTKMGSVFQLCPAFDQDLSSWNTANVTLMSSMFRDSGFDQDIGNWDISSTTTLSAMFTGAPLSVANYDAILIGWGAQSQPSGVTFHGGELGYTSAGEVGRDQLLARGWSITDGGLT
jgi:surface protein